MTKSELIASLQALPCDDSTPVEVGVYVGDCDDPALSGIVSVTVGGVGTPFAGCLSATDATTVVLATY